jgi:hypothetical protein
MKKIIAGQPLAIPSKFQLFKGGGGGGRGPRGGAGGNSNPMQREIKN